VGTAVSPEQPLPLAEPAGSGPASAPTDAPAAPRAGSAALQPKLYWAPQPHCARGAGAAGGSAGAAERGLAWPIG
jgi:hypothetical protein